MPCAFVTVRVKVVVAARAAVVQFPPLPLGTGDGHVPPGAVFHAPVAGPLFIDHVSVEVSPGVIEFGFAVSVHAGAFATDAGFIVIDRVFVATLALLSVTVAVKE